MRKACVSVNGIKAGILEELKAGSYQFTYFDDYHGTPVSLTMPLINKIHHFVRGAMQAIQFFGLTRPVRHHLNHTCIFYRMRLTHFHC